MTDGIHHQFVESEPDMQRSIRCEQHIVTGNLHEICVFLNITIDLLLEQIAEIGAAPARIRDQVL